MLFQACDIDGSGFIGIEEVKEICSGIGASDSDAKEIFSKLDQDGDGLVSFQDFCAGFDAYEKGVLVATSPLKSPSKNPFSFTQHEKKPTETSNKTQNQDSKPLTKQPVVR